MENLVIDDDIIEATSEFLVVPLYNKIEEQLVYRANGFSIEDIKKVKETLANELKNIYAVNNDPNHVYKKMAGVYFDNDCYSIKTNSFEGNIFLNVALSNVDINYKPGLNSLCIWPSDMLIKLYGGYATYECKPRNPLNKKYAQNEKIIALNKHGVKQILSSNDKVELLNNYLDEFNIELSDIESDYYYKSKTKLKRK